MSAPGFICGFGTTKTGGVPYWCWICAEAQAAGVLAEPSGFTTAGDVAAKPPSNQPQVMPFRFSRSPIFLLVICTVALPVAVPPASAPQSSRAGSGSPVTVTGEEVSTWPLAKVKADCPLPVWPEIKLIAPTVDGPKLVSKELSFMA